jgi:chromosome segregation ATPase
MAKSIAGLLNGSRFLLPRKTRPIHQSGKSAPAVHQTVAELPPLQSETSAGAGRLAAVQSEFDQFSALLSREIATFSAIHAKLEADHALQSRRLAETARELREAREALDVSLSQNAAVASDHARLRNENASALLRIDALSGDLHVAREQLTQHQMRCERLEADHFAAVDDANRKDVALIEARQELNDLKQRFETQRVQVEQARHRESELEARVVMLDIELKELGPRFHEVSRQSALQRDKVQALETETQAARIELDARDRRLSELLAERDKLAETCSHLNTKLAESRDHSEVKVDALSKTKSFLWNMSEKQRKQIADQITRISRLESDNSRLTQALLDADAKSEPKRAAPKPQQKATDGPTLN